MSENNTIKVRDVTLTNEDGDTSTHWVRAELAVEGTPVKVKGDAGYTVTKIGDQELDAEVVGVKAADLDEVKPVETKAAEKHPATSSKTS